MLNKSESTPPGPGDPESQLVPIFTQLEPNSGLSLNLKYPTYPTPSQPPYWVTHSQTRRETRAETRSAPAQDQVGANRFNDVHQLHRTLPQIGTSQNPNAPTSPTLSLNQRLTLTAESPLRTFNKKNTELLCQLCVSAE